MIIRDIKIFSAILQNKIDLGLPLDSSIGFEFEKKTMHKNFIFSNSIDFIFEFFNFERKFKNKSLIKLLKFIGNNNILKDKLINLADKGKII